MRCVVGMHRSSPQFPVLWLAGAGCGRERRAQRAVFERRVYEPGELGMLKGTEEPLLPWQVS